MNPMTRIAVVAAALAVAIGAALLALGPAPDVGPPASPTPAPPTIEGTWDVTYTSQELLNAGAIPHVAEDPDDYGHFHLTFSRGLWQRSHLEPTSYVDAARTYTLEPGIVHMFSPGDTVNDASYTVTATTLTFGPNAPFQFRVKPWTRIATEPIGTPSPRAAVPTITPIDVGKTLASGTYRVDAFAAPFVVTLPADWIVSDFSENSITIERRSDGTINVALIVMNKVYGHPCHPDRPSTGPRAIGPGVEALVAAFSSMPGFEISDVSDATVGGASGKSFQLGNEIDVPLSECLDDRLVIGTYDREGEDVDIAMFGGESDLFWVVDSAGTRVLIAITNIPSIVEATRPVLESLSFGFGSSN
jgi:hypothetical protein